jgi:hypothetical protein
MKLLLTTPPVQEPLTMDEVRSYLRLSGEHEDGLLSTLMAAARAHVETITGRALLKQRWQMDLRPPYPLSSPLVRRMEKHIVIQLPKPPLLEIESLTVNEKAILFTQEEGKVILSTRFWDEAIRISYWAGYGETGTSLPPDLKMAVLMATRCFYDHQEADLPLLKPFNVLHVV